MARRKQSSAEYIEAQGLLVPFILSEMIEHLGQASQAWSQAVWAARAGDLDKALEYVVEAQVAVDIPVTVGRKSVRAIVGRASNLLDAELPNDDHQPGSTVLRR